MDTQNLTTGAKNKIKTEVKQEAEVKIKQNIKPKNNAKAELVDKRILDKDKEIAILKAKLADSQEINKIKKGDIRAEVNRQGDPKLIKIGKDAFGKSIWKVAKDLTNADIERRLEYIESIKQKNAKKY